MRRSMELRQAAQPIDASKIVAFLVNGIRGLNTMIIFLETNLKL